MNLLKFLLWSLDRLMWLGVTAALATYFYLEPQLPRAAELRDIRLQVPLRVFSADGKLIAEFGEARRVPLKYEEMPPLLIKAFLAAEDDRFFEHPGVDYQGLLRAALDVATTGHARQGGSTITMQMARNFYLSSEKRLERKLVEILLSLRIEREMTKEEILTLYLNKIFLGNRAYGVGAAAQIYYGKRVHELDLAEVAMIAGLPKAPSNINPIAAPEAAHQRREYVLRRMTELGYITQAEREAAGARPETARVYTTQADLDAPYMAEMVRAEMVTRFGDQAYTNGYRVITTLDSRRQMEADEALRQALMEYDHRHGYHGPERQFDLSSYPDQPARDRLLRDIPTFGGLRPALVTEVADKALVAYLGGGEYITVGWEALEWARRYRSEDSMGPKPRVAADVAVAGDLIRVKPQTAEDGTVSWQFAALPQVEGALVSVNPDNGAIVALSGGFDFYRSKFNRATQARRQPGSGFKPFIYAAALDAGLTPATVIDDAPISFYDPGSGKEWRPQNFDMKFKGPMRMREALTHSRNVVSIRILEQIGLPKATAFAALFGFEGAQLAPNLSLALGTAEVTPLQMAAGYAVFANGGYRVPPYFIARIDQGDERPIFIANPPLVCEGCDLIPTLPVAKGRFAEDYAAIQASAGPLEVDLDLLKNPPKPAEAPRAIRAEVAFLMNSMLRDVVEFGTARKAKSLGRKDLAGKTGTTNDQIDAWFNGFQRNLATVVWIGLDSNKPLGRAEQGGRAALPAWMYYMGKALEGTPERTLDMPPGIVQTWVDRSTGWLAHADDEGAMSEYFIAGTEPQSRPPDAEYMPWPPDETSGLPGASGPPPASSLPAEIF